MPEEDVDIRPVQAALLHVDQSRGKQLIYISLGLTFAASQTRAESFLSRPAIAILPSELAQPAETEFGPRSQMWMLDDTAGNVYADKEVSRIIRLPDCHAACDLSLTRSRSRFQYGE